MKKIITLTLALISIILMTGCGTKTVKVQKYIEVEYSPAYSGYAEPTLKINEEELNKFIDLKKVEKLFKKAMKQNKEEIEEYRELLDEFDMEVEDIFEMFGDDIKLFSEYFDIEFAENYENLSNGDKIVVNITPREDVSKGFGLTTKKFLKGLGLKLSKEKLEIKVKGLEKLKVAELDLDEMLEIDFGKYDGYSTPTVKINTSYLRKVTIPEFVKDYAYDHFGNTRSLIYEDYDWFDVEFDKAYSNLKNGDKVTVNVTLNDELEEDKITLEELEKELGIKLKRNSKTFKVSGLEKPKNVIDVFEGVEKELFYRGANGTGYINGYTWKFPDDYSKQIDDLYFTFYDDTSIKIVHKNERLGVITFNVKGDNLKKGDVIEITAEAPVEELEKLGYVVPTLKTNVTVPDLGEYMKTREQLTPEVLEAVKDKVLETRGIDKIEKLYFTTYKPGVECEFESAAFVVAIVYKGGWFGGYYIDELNDIIIKPDGTVDIEDYKKDSWSDDSLEEAEGRFAIDMYDFELLESSVDDTEAA